MREHCSDGMDLAVIKLRYSIIDCTNFNKVCRFVLINEDIKGFILISTQKITLDDDAQKLFAELEGLDRSERIRDVSPENSGLKVAISEEEKRNDDFRILLVEFPFLFADSINSGKLTGIVSLHNDDINSMLTILTRLAEFSNHNGAMAFA